MKKTLLLIFLLLSTEIYSQNLPLKWINAGISETIVQFLLNPAGDEVAILDRKGYLKIIDLSKNKITCDYYLPRCRRIIDFSDNKDYIFLDNSNGFWLFNYQTGKSLIGKNITNTSILGKGYSGSTDTVAIANYSYYEYYNNPVEYLQYSWGVHIYDFKNEKYYSIDDTSFTLKNRLYDNNIKLNRAIAISQKGDRLAIGNDSGYINLYSFDNYNDFKLIRQFKNSNDSLTLGLLFSENGSQLISTHPSGLINIQSTFDGKIDYQITIKSLRCLLFSKKVKDNKVVIKYEDNSKKIDYYIIFDLKMKQIIDSVEIDKNLYPNYSISDDLSKIVYGMVNSNLFYKRINDSDMIDLTAKFNIRKIQYGALNKNYLLTYNPDSILYFQSKSDGKFIKNEVICKNPIKIMKLSPDGNKILTVSNDLFQLWNLETEKAMAQISIPNHNKDWINGACCYSADSKSFWVGCNGNYIHNYNCSDGKLLKIILIKTQYPKYVRDLAVNLDDTRIAVGSDYADDQHSMRWGYDFVDITKDEMTNEFLETIPGDLTSAMFGSYIDNRNFFTSFTANSGYSLYNGQICKWKLPDLLSIKYSLPNGTDYDLIQDKFIILKKLSLLILYSSNGLISFYKYDDANPKFTFDAYITLSKVVVDEENLNLYAMSTNGTVKCYDIGDLITFLDVNENLIENTTQTFVYPNPASDYIEINVPRWRGQGVDLQGMSPVRIFDLLGVEQLPRPDGHPFMLEGEVVRIDVSSLQPGVYFVRVGNEVRKFVKM